MVAIKDFEMPESCNNCPMSIGTGFCEVSCSILDEVIHLDCYEICKKRMDNCPLVEIKENEDGKID